MLTGSRRLLPVLGAMTSASSRVSAVHRRAGNGRVESIESRVKGHPLRTSRCAGSERNQRGQEEASFDPVTNWTSVEAALQGESAVL